MPHSRMYGQKLIQAPRATTTSSPEWLLPAVLLGVCCLLTAPAAKSADELWVRIGGLLVFEASYETSQVAGQVPPGRASALPYLFLCAWSRHDGKGEVDHDFALSFGAGSRTSPVASDELIGCTTAGADGAFSIEGEYHGSDFYLVTYLCDGPDGGEHEPLGDLTEAKVCVRADLPGTSLARLRDT